MEQAIARWPAVRARRARSAVYFHHRSELGEFWLSSDAATPNFEWLPLVIDRFPEVGREGFGPIGYMIGGRIVFPAWRFDGKMTINGARAFHRRIRDWFDLTVECIRRHYLGEPSTLNNVLARNMRFFGLSDGFAGYVDFFHLQDLVNEATSTVKFLRSSRTSPASLSGQPPMSISTTASARGRVHRGAQPADCRVRCGASAANRYATPMVIAAVRGGARAYRSRRQRVVLEELLGAGDRVGLYDRHTRSASCSPRRLTGRGCSS